MNYRFQAFYQRDSDELPQLVELSNLHEYVGEVLARNIINKVEHRMSDESLPQVKAFFQDGRTRIIAMDYTNRGNVFVEVCKA